MNCCRTVIYIKQKQLRFIARKITNPVKGSQRDCNMKGKIGDVTEDIVISNTRSSFIERLSSIDNTKCPLHYFESEYDPKK